MEWNRLLIFNEDITLCEKSPSTEFFLVQIRESTDQKKLHISTLFTQCQQQRISSNYELFMWLTIYIYISEIPRNVLISVIVLKFFMFLNVIFDLVSQLVTCWSGWSKKSIVKQMGLRDPRNPSIKTAIVPFFPSHYDTLQKVQPLLFEQTNNNVVTFCA